MNPTSTSVEAVFARALEMPAGSGRDQLVAAQCAHDPALRREVESLLQAHDSAGNFLRAPVARPAASPLTGTAVLNAAACAGAFLRQPDAGDGLEAYLATLPEVVRREASGLKHRHPTHDDEAVMDGPPRDGEAGMSGPPRDMRAGKHV